MGIEKKKIHCVKENPVLNWTSPTSILYGRKDNMSSYDDIKLFKEKFECSLDISEDSEHFFHTEKDLNIYIDWILSKIKPAIN